MHQLKFLFGILLLSFSLSAIGQTSELIDEVVGNIYNLDFQNAKIKLAELEKADPQMARYLKFDFFWWKMISSNSVVDESEFLIYKNAFLENIDKDNRDFMKLIYFLYQIRYDNFKKSGFSKYLTALKCQVYLQMIDEKKMGALKANERTILQLIVEFDKCLQYKYLSDFGLFKQHNERELFAGMEKIERLENREFKSFKTIKNYFLGKMYLEIVHDKVKGLEKFSRLSEDYPRNTVFREIRNRYQLNTTSVGPQSYNPFGSLLDLCTK